MNILYILIPVALGMGLFFLVLFIWSARQGQYDDLSTPSIRILLDETHSKTNPQEKTT